MTYRMSALSGIIVLTCYSIGVHADPDNFRANKTITAGPLNPFPGTEGMVMGTGQVAGIGFMKRGMTTTPSAAGDISIWYNKDGIARLWTPVKEDLLAIRPDGRVGIGVSNPSQDLEISENGKKIFFDAGNTQNFSTYGYTGFSNLFGSGPLSINPTQRVILNQFAGKTGIRTANPKEALDVKGNVVQSGSENWLSIEGIGYIGAGLSGGSNGPGFYGTGELNLSKKVGKKINFLDGFNKYIGVDSNNLNIVNSEQGSNSVTTMKIDNGSKSKFRVENRDGMQLLTVEGKTGQVGIGVGDPAFGLELRKKGNRVVRVGDNQGNALSIDVAGGQGLVNLVAGAHVKDGTHNYVYAGNRGASRILMHDGSLSLLTSTTKQGTAGTKVNWRSGLKIEQNGDICLGKC